MFRRPITCGFAFFLLSLRRRPERSTRNCLNELTANLGHARPRTGLERAGEVSGHDHARRVRPSARASLRQSRIQAGVDQDRARCGADPDEHGNARIISFCISQKARRTAVPSRTGGPRRAHCRLRAEAAPLAGFHIALDPGHLGGTWAQMEERWFKIDDAPPVQEGDMTLRVARLLAPRLESLGAKVSLRATEDGADHAHAAPRILKRLPGNFCSAAA